MPSAPWDDDSEAMRWKRRLGRLGLAAWYALLSTNLLAGRELIAPLTKRVASIDVPRAHHDCGCKTAEQCRLHCCCHPQITPRSRPTSLCHLPHTQPMTVRVSYWSEARCRGHDRNNPLLTQKLDPHLPVTERLVRIVERPRRRAANGCLSLPRSPRKNPSLSCPSRLGQFSSSS